MELYMVKDNGKEVTLTNVIKVSVPIKEIDTEQEYRGAYYFLDMHRAFHFAKNLEGERYGNK